MPTNKTALERRLARSIVVSRMFVTMARQLANGVGRGGHAGVIMPELLVMMTVRLNDHRRGRPITISALARSTGLPRTSVRRCIAPLIEMRIIKAEGDGYVGDLTFLRQTVNASYFHSILRAIARAARELESIR